MIDLRIVDETVNIHGGDMGVGDTLRPMSDGRWLVSVMAETPVALEEKVASLPAGGVEYKISGSCPHCKADLTQNRFPVYAASGGLARAKIAYLMYDKNPLQENY